MDAKGN